MGNRGKSARWPISRVLYPWFPTGDDHSSGTSVTGRLTRPTRAATRKCVWLRLREGCRPYLVLLPVGFTVPPSVAGDAVRSYRTLSISLSRSCSDLLSVALSLGSLQPVVNRHRHFVEPGLSSPWKLPATPRPPGPLAWVPLYAFEARVILLIDGRLFMAAYSSPRGFGSSSASRMARHSPQITPSISSGRNRR